MKCLTRIVSLFFCCLSTFLLGCSRAPASPPVQSVKEYPFRFVDSKIIILAQTPEGDLHLELDTGSPYLILTSEAQQRLHLQLHSVPETPVIQKGTIAGLRLGQVTLPKADFYVLDMDAALQKTKAASPPSPIDNLTLQNQQHPDDKTDGLLGISCLRGLAVGIDMEHQKIAFWKSSKAGTGLNLGFIEAVRGSPFPNGVTRIPLITTEDRLLIDVKIPNVTARLILDTGAGLSVAGNRLAPYLHRLTPGRQGTLNMLSKEFAGNLSAVTDLDFGAGRLPCSWFAATDVSSEEDENLQIGILGLIVFAHSRFVIDLPAKKLWFARYSTDEDAKEQRILGLGMAPLPTQNGWYGVLFPGTQKSAGLKENDLVTAINHIPLYQLTDADVAGNDVTLTLFRPHLNKNEPGKIAGQDVIVLLKQLKGHYPPARPTYPETRMMPGEDVIYYLPYGGTYVPPGCKDSVTPPAGSQNVPTPTGGYIIVNSGADRAKSILVGKASDANKFMGSFYMLSPDHPVTIVPGSYWDELWDGAGKGTFMITSPPKTLDSTSDTKPGK